MSLKAHVTTEKKKEVDEFAKLLVDYPIIGVINVETLPSRQLQAMRGKLRESVLLKMTKRRLLKLAVEKAKAQKPGIEKIMDYSGGMPVLLFTKENPFKLYKVVEKSKSKSPIKAGQKAPYDLIIPKGPTPFAPGPVISELANLKIKAGVEAGKIAIKEDALVLKEGDVCSGPLASMLLRLSIEPMEIGLDLVAMYENGMFYEKNVLSINDDKLKADITQAHTWALNLAVEAKVINKATVELMVMKAQREALAVESATSQSQEGQS
jgi:large subunit ribosomal protein L10